MKVDPNQLVGSVFDHGTDPQFGVIGGIPLRLALSSLCMGVSMQVFQTAIEGGRHHVDITPENIATNAMLFADTLIAVHNATCGEVSE